MLCRARVKCFAFNFSFTPCGCTSFLSWPCRCISLTVIARLFIFVSSLRSFLLLLLLLCIVLFFYKTTIALLRRGCLSSAFSPKVYHFLYLFSWCKITQNISFSICRKLLNIFKFRHKHIRNLKI